MQQAPTYLCSIIHSWRNFYPSAISVQLNINSCLQQHQQHTYTGTLRDFIASGTLARKRCSKRASESSTIAIACAHAKVFSRCKALFTQTSEVHWSVNYITVVCADFWRCSVAAVSIRLTVTEIREAPRQGSPTNQTARIETALPMIFQPVQRATKRVFGATWITWAISFLSWAINTHPIDCAFLLRDEMLP